MSSEEYRAIRKRLGLSQQRLGELVGRDQVTISRRERGEHPIDREAGMAIRLLLLLHFEEHIALE